MSCAPPQDSPIQFIVVGGSVGGLCAAYGLRQSGHSVVVLDKRNEGENSYGGLRVPPNMTRLLETLPGVAGLLKEHGSECNGMTFLKGETSKIIGRMQFSDEAMADLGCKFHMIPYDVLMKHLVQICERSGVQLRFQNEVSSVIVAPGQRPAVVTITGQQIEGDVLIGADGHGSIIHNTLVQQPEDQEDNDSESLAEKESNVGVHNIVGATYSIEMGSLVKAQDPELLELAESKEFMIWPGSHVLVTGHRCGNELYIINVVRTGATPVAIDSKWSPKAPFPRANVLAEFEPRVKRLVKVASHCHQTIQQRTLQRIINTSTGIVVIGDAAHTITIHATHNSSIAVEDGFALGRIFSHATSRDQIPYLLRGYQEVRHVRCIKTEASELQALTTITLPPGPERDRRNEQFSISLQNAEDMSDEVLAATWEDYLDQFNYDANDAVDEWWLMGRFNIDNNGNGEHVV